MLSKLRPGSGLFGRASLPGRLWEMALGFFVRHPYISLFLFIFAANGFGSVFNISYNIELIVKRYMNKEQTLLFKYVALPVYNLIAYSTGIALTLYFLMPLIRCRQMMLSKTPVSDELLQSARRRLVDLPTYLICFDLMLWLPGAVFFPLIICLFGGTNEWLAITIQFLVSFIVSSLITAANTFFLVEWLLTVSLYPLFFRDARPADVPGVIRMPFWLRLLLLWFAVAFGPIVALLVVALNPSHNDADAAVLRDIALVVALLGIAASGFVSLVVGGDLLVWLRQYARATEQIRNEHFSERIVQKRPDELGQLNDRFNDMATGLETGQRVYENFGQFVGVDARGEMLDMLSGFGGEVRDITMYFLDIRGFTRRSAGERPERVVELLNQFLTLAVAAVEEHDGMVNKFLGDGLMAIFGGPPDWRSDHADLAVSSAVHLLRDLDAFNSYLQKRGEEPLRIGVGIHSGPALVGCVGATMQLHDGRQRTGRPRKELTAIGETVNNCQRVEQLTKKCGGPILISGETCHLLQMKYTLIDLGMQQLDRSDQTLHIFEVKV